jgi:glycogen operon protein
MGVRGSRAPSRPAAARGDPWPLGATISAAGVNFSVFSRGSTALELLFFDGAGDERPARTLELDPRANRSYHYWHVFVPEVGPGQLYGWRAQGPHEPERGLRFDPEKVLLDPYGRAVCFPPGRSRAAAVGPGDNSATALKSVVADMRAYDWEGDRPLARPFSETVIYELHVGGFTKHPSSGVAPGRRGTFAGLVEKIPYLQELGITAVELLPVFCFDPEDAPAGRRNYWGYSPLSFFAPHPGYGSGADPLSVLDEFRDMVKSLHRAGIEVLLDVVFNHTAEGNERGPTLCFRGLADDVYYHLEGDGRSYSNYAGTGNTLNANQPVVRRLIGDSLRFWVEEMHVDGFRFDLASILSRDERGRPVENPPVLWDLESDPVLARTKLIAEAWDAAGLYQVGRFVGESWKEWNGRFRDDLRRFVRGDEGTVSLLATRLLGSPDIFGHEEREPEQSVHFVTCHDGFTLNDLVSYDRKHNEANGEENRDGADENFSWNCGHEGPTDDPGIEALRNRQVKNFLALDLVAFGAPMLLMGDELRRTQRGNNNAYCLDDETSWLDWSLLERHADLHRFTRLLIALRLRTRVEDGASLNQILRGARIDWHGVRLGRPDWSHASHSLGATVWSRAGEYVLHFLFNAWWEPLEFELPEPPAEASGGWRRWIDTALPSPDDVRPRAEAPRIDARSYRAAPRSVVLLAAGLPAGAVKQGARGRIPAAPAP